MNNIPIAPTHGLFPLGRGATLIPGAILRDRQCMDLERVEGRRSLPDRRTLSQQGSVKTTDETSKGSSPRMPLPTVEELGVGSRPALLLFFSFLFFLPITLFAGGEEADPPGFQNPEGTEKEAPEWIEDDLLSDYITEALSENPTVRGAQYQYQAAQLERPQARWSLPDPQFNSMIFPQGMLWPGGEQYASLTLQQMFPWFGTLSSREEMAEIMSQAEYESFRNEYSETIFEVREVYYEMFEVQQKIKIKEEHLSLLESFINLARMRLETGQGRSAEVLTTEMDKEDLRNEIERLKDRIPALQQDMASLLNRDDFEALELPDTLPEPEPQADPRELKQQIAERHPSIERFRQMKNYYEQKERTAQLEGRPQIGLGAEYMVMSPTDQFDLGHNGDNMFVPMVSISLPIYRSRINAEREQALVQAERARTLQEREKNQLFKDWEGEVADYQDAARLIDHYREQVRRSNRALSLLQQDYAGEQVTFEEVLRMQQQLLDYEINLTEAITDNNLSVAKLEYLSQRE